MLLHLEGVCPSDCHVYEDRHLVKHSIILNITISSNPLVLNVLDLANLLYLLLILISIQQLTVTSESTGLNIMCQQAQSSA